MGQSPEGQQHTQLDSPFTLQLPLCPPLALLLALLSSTSRPVLTTPPLACHCLCSFAPYFAEPVIAGLDEEGKPFITATDLIGAAVTTDDFVVAGTCSENLYGMCESLYRKDMNPDELFEVISQALLAAVDRDALSGWGAVVHIVTPEGVTTRELKGRMD